MRHPLGRSRWPLPTLLLAASLFSGCLAPTPTTLPYGKRHPHHHCHQQGSSQRCHHHHHGPGHHRP